MSGMSEEEINEIEARVAAQPDTLEELAEVVMSLEKRIEMLEEDSHAATTGLALLTDKLKKAGVIG